MLVQYTPNIYFKFECSFGLSIEVCLRKSIQMPPLRPFLCPCSVSSMDSQRRASLGRVRSSICWGGRDAYAVLWKLITDSLITQNACALLSCPLVAAFSNGKVVKYHLHYSGLFIYLTTIAWGHGR
jgi:hypothetical protein